MIPLTGKLYHSLDARLSTWPGVLHGYRGRWDRFSHIRASQIDGEPQPCVYVRLCDCWWAKERYLWAVTFFFHDRDWSSHPIRMIRELDSHLGDSEWAGFLFPWPKSGIAQQARWAIVRSHYRFRVYETPNLLHGRHWLYVEPEGHAVRLVNDFGEVPKERFITYLNYRRVCMDGPEYKPFEEGYRSLFQKFFRIDYPDVMFDWRMPISRFTREAIRPWEEPMRFIDQAPRCGIRFERPG